MKIKLTKFINRLFQIISNNNLPFIKKKKPYNKNSNNECTYNIMEYKCPCKKIKRH